MGTLIEIGATVVAHGGRWWPGDIYRVADGVWVAVCGARMYRVIPAAGFWRYAGVHKEAV
jgi:hypothetical protein